MSKGRSRPSGRTTAVGERKTPYNPLAVEPRRYQEWLEGGYFHAPVDPTRRPFCIMMPLPNITGSLHMGHALNHTIQDLLTRWRRMQGYNAMWLPGTDHASIATHVVMERELAKEGKTRFDLGREKFLEFAWQWKAKYGDLIYSQIRRMGNSCDWDRVTFTMDPAYYDAVIECFLRLYQKGYIYYGKRMINWCPKDLTSVSDLEVNYQTVQSHLWYVRYPGADGGGGVVIATQRPETILADVAVAVHPDDERYAGLVGRQVIVPIVHRRVPVIADRRVDPAFGTGALKITPGHDPLDHEIGAAHGLPVLVILDERGRMTAETGAYAGMDRFEAREAVARDLEAAGLVERKEPYATNVGLCDRCRTVLEPYITDQWFCRMEALARPAIDVVRQGRVRFHPERWTKVYLDWMEHIHDWNISRRLWFGHRIPVWHCANGHQVAGRQAPVRCPHCGGSDLQQEEQILDTWFSSAAWPFATLGWPKDTPDLRYFYPTSVLVTGRDIIFLWVARMIMFGLEFVGDVPFTDVYINPTVLNIQGRRMSKSLGTGLDPLDYVEQGYGADALRFALTLRCSQGQQDLRFGEKMLEDVRNFNNKLWNAARFVRMHLGDFTPAAGVRPAACSLFDRWIRSRYGRLIGEVTASLEAFDFDKVARALYDFVWSEYCDWYVELAKVDLYRPDLDPVRRLAIQHTLWQVLEGTLRLLHPIIPHITEEIWQALPHQGKSIMIAPWPGLGDAEVDEAAEEGMATITAVVRAIRSMRADLGMAPQTPVAPVLRAGDRTRELLEAHRDYVATLARAPGLAFAGGGVRPRWAVGTVVEGVEVSIEVAEADRARARRRLTAELAAAKAELDRTIRRLQDAAFLSRAPAEVVEEDRRREAVLRDRTHVLAGYLAALD
ncbi:MAG: valine--tRNA ligase [Armatimonadota bacterium]|nr:valine--tRNA ligase [Armatimonadota bacterium]